MVSGWYFRIPKFPDYFLKRRMKKSAFSPFWIWKDGMGNGLKKFIRKLEPNKIKRSFEYYSHTRRQYKRKMKG